MKHHKVKELPDNISKVTIYTDGACSGNPGPGGWGAVLIWNDLEKDIFGGVADTTNNRMELQAVIEALALLKKPCHVTIYTDSKYVLNGATQWMAEWKERGWKTATRKPVVNKDLWLRIDEELERHHVIFEWVKGHSGDEMNERADKLAVRGRRHANRDKE